MDVEGEIIKIINNNKVVQKILPFPVQTFSHEKLKT